MIDVLNVMFECPETRVAVRVQRLRPMTRAQFETWRDRFRDSHVEDCPACPTRGPEWPPRH